jgi:release factor glutamine methyltransferase
MTVRDIISNYREVLSSAYEPEELTEIISLAFEAVKGFSKTELITRNHEKVSAKEAYELGTIVHDLKKNRPIQYILGYCWFFGLKLKVNEHVLIPRPETEELVRWVTDEIRSAKTEIQNVLDIGTGSGCIPIVHLMLQNKMQRH